MNLTPREWALLIVALFLMLWIPMAHAAPVTIKVCDGATPLFRQPAGTDRLEVRCPQSAEPVLTVVGCLRPRVTRTGDWYTLTCGSWKRYDLVPRP